MSDKIPKFPPGAFADPDASQEPGDEELFEMLLAQGVPPSEVHANDREKYSQWLQARADSLDKGGE